MADLESSVHLNMVASSMKYCINNNIALQPKAFDQLEVDNIIDSKISKVSEFFLR